MKKYIEQYSKIMASGDLANIWESLQKVMEKQSEYEKNYSEFRAASTAVNLKSDTAEKFSIAGDVSAQGSHLQEMSDLIGEIKAKLESLESRVNKNERAMDALEQYSRSNCLILHGSQLPAPESNSDNQQPQQVGRGLPVDTGKCEKHVLKTLNGNLNLPTPISSTDIDICHPLPSNKNKSPIIIKFVRRTVRNMVFFHKKDLKGKLDGTHKLSITESLTKRRLRLLDAARDSFLFTNVWTMNGNVFCKFKGRKHYIDDFDDISKIRFPREAPEVHV